MMKAYLVAGLGAGDEGKGATVDYLCRRSGAGLVVRFNGGPQAAHRVVSDGKSHVFSQFGAGTFAGARTYLSQFTMIDPYALLNEVEALEAVGMTHPERLLTIHPGAGVVTPYHWLSNKIRESMRGHGRHGSCGMGVGEATKDREDGFGLRAGELGDSLAILKAIQARKVEEFRKKPMVEDAAVLFELLRADAPEKTARFYRDFATAFGRQIRPIEIPTGYPVVFEGAQGMLLDSLYGFAPHNSWTDASFFGANFLLWESGQARRDRVRLGVLRTYATRHGAGPLPSADAYPTAFPEAVNGDHDWQGPFRQGPFDAVLARYALRSIGGVDGLAITHVDRVDEKWPMVRSWTAGEEVVFDLEPRVVAAKDIAQYAPRLSVSPGSMWRSTIEAALGATVAFYSTGPEAKDWHDTEVQPALTVAASGT